VRGSSDFLDTNVLFYEWDGRDPSKSLIARKLMERDPRQMAISTQVIHELSWTLSKKLGLSYSEIAELIQGYRSLKLVRMDISITLVALRIAERYQISFWDALIVAAAKEARCTRILTEDLSHGQIIEGIQVFNPFIPTT
jgi:predicted nucleic acid-binding protein